MKLSQIERLVKSAAIQKKHIPIALIGPSGVGKSAIVKQVAAELKIGCIDLRLASQEPGDLIGIPRASGDKTVWLKPHWWPEEGTSGILFLDELNRAPVEVRQAVFQVLTEWKMHEHILPDNWIIVTAMNPEGKDGYQVEMLDPAMLNRMLQINVDYSADEWLAYAHKEKLDKRVIGFISAHKALLHKVKESGAFPSPRTWTYVSNLLDMEALEESCLTETVSGLVGSEAAASFMSWVKKNYERPVSGEEVLKGDKEAFEKIKIQTRSQNNTTATDLAALLNSMHKEQKKLTKDQRANVREFMFSLPEHDDVIVAFMKKLPPPLVSLEIICEDTPQANKLATLYTQISKSADLGTGAKKVEKK